ncbi:hypothetical protein J6TS1_08140 [Siminovitchia terrae]|uniref:Uncharacterized protein n=1 Tax=Siminovitchia terrae TaxID=1914933 RepID=A0ABQ4KTI1_SIMTE|nr:hypothetical protein [Siminovitchia terrae]GIN94944.1 hypothetical protein J6TS1_08140 [Siminovitchia terrae]
MNVYWYSIQWGFKHRLNKVKPPADATDFQRKFIELKLDKIWAQIRQGAFDKGLSARIRNRTGTEG